MITPGTYDPAAKGCTSCGSQATVTVDGLCGRRCSHCPPPFDSEFAALLVGLGAVDEAWIYLRAWISGEIKRRFDAAVVAL